MGGDETKVSKIVLQSDRNDRVEDDSRITA
jgi:hypothetical protein